MNTQQVHPANDVTMLDRSSVDAQELEYVRQILARAGYSGPIAPAACPLEDWVKLALASDDVATQLETAGPNDRGAISLALGVDKTLEVVADMLFGILPEQTVVVALDLLKAEHVRLVSADVGTPTAAKAIDGNMARHVLFNLIDQAILDVQTTFGIQKVTMVVSWRQPTDCPRTTFNAPEDLRVAMDEFDDMQRNAARIEFVNGFRNLRFVWDVDGNSGTFDYNHAEICPR